MTETTLEHELARRLAAADSLAPPEAAPNWQFIGSLRYRLGDLPGAVEALQRAAALAPAEPAYLLNLAELARVQDQPDAAADWLQRAAEVTARAPDAGRLNLLAAAWLDLGRPDEALEAAAGALALGDSIESRRLFIAALRGARRIGVAARGLVARALAEAWAADRAAVAPAAAAILKATWPHSGQAMVEDPLLAAMLTSGLVQDAEIERRLTAVRRALLLSPAGEGALPLQARLAMQGFINDYAWQAPQDEAEAVRALSGQVAASDRPAAGALLSLAAYHPLGRLPNAARLLAGDWPEPVRWVLQQQIAEPARDRAYAESTPTLTPIRPGVSELVRAQYEENPYPRWIKAGQIDPLPLQALLGGLFPHAGLQPVPGGDRPEILVAGCGTGRQAIQTARRHPAAQVLAVDLSRASLGYARRKSVELGCHNIAYGQADLLELGALGRTFDAIVCSGVLHHLADPMEGARVLCAMLRPGGVMSVGLYSAVARQAFEPARRLAAGFQPTEAGIRALRQAILAAPADDPVRAVTSVGDFYATSTCRDLLMHVQEQAFETPQLRSLVEANGLRFLGFAAPAEVLGAYRQAFPADPGATDFDNWADFERRRPRTFIGMYQFWIQKPA